MNLQELSQRVQHAIQQSGKANFFGASRKGEVFELQQQLNSNYAADRVDGIKRVIANMTVGKDVSGLLPSMIKNMQTENLEQKKLVYLYLINYAKSFPDLVILAVNTFVKDTDDPNPLIRALAIRTMGVLRAEKIIDYISDPLRKCLRDDNPYVRKTAALCVAKLYDSNPVLAVENGFITALQDMVGDSNPMVVANAITALSEIEEAAFEETGEAGTVFKIDSSILAKLLIALGECTEWGRISLLTAIAKYQAGDEKEAEHICERVVPQFQHANGSVVLAAIKVVLIHIRQCRREEFVRSIMRKLAPPLVTLVSSAPEVQWVALRNINLILQKRPDVLSNEMRVFFCKYNDPAYVKLEKLEIMIKLANEKNIDTLLSELKEYANEVDYDFVKRAIRAIGTCAIKIDSAAERCVNVLLDLIATRVSYVVQEAVIVIKDIFRKYPHRYEGIIPTLCANLEDLDEPEAKASLIWILGEYAEKIDNADEILSTFLSTFSEEAFVVQLQTLTAIVKLYLKRPEVAQTLVQRVLESATKGCDNPDIRDRAYVYWRLLSTDPEAAKAVVLAPRPPISIPLSNISPALLEELTNEISTLASVYHKPVEAFIGRGRLGADELSRKGAQALSQSRGGGASNAAGASSSTRSAAGANNNIDLVGLGDDDAAHGATTAIRVVAQGQRSENLLDFGDDDDENRNTLSLGSMVTPGQGTATTSSLATGRAGAGASAAVPPPAKSANPMDDLMGLFDSAGLGPASVLGANATSTITPGAPSAGMMASMNNGSSSSNGAFDSLGSFGSPSMPQQGGGGAQKAKSDMDLMGDLF